MPILIRSVRAPTAAAMLSGADRTERCGSKWSSDSHIASSPQRSAASICSNASANASFWVRPGSAGNWWNMPNSIGALPFGPDADQYCKAVAPNTQYRMSEEAPNMVLEHLRAIRAELHEIRDEQREQRGRL